MKSLSLQLNRKHPDMLQTKGLVFAYDELNSFQFPDIECRKGEQWLIMGPSGCGKTTLLHLLAGLLRSYQGSIRIHDTEISTLPTSGLDAFRGKEIGIVFQTPHFIDSLNVEENLLLARYLNGFKENRTEIIPLLDKLGILHKRKSMPHELSQGELQRLSIARSIVNNPSLILADEPTSSLDDHNCNEAINLLKKQAESTGSTLLIVTHDHRLAAHFTHVVQLQK